MRRISIILGVVVLLCAQAHAVYYDLVVTNSVNDALLAFKEIIAVNVTRHEVGSFDYPRSVYPGEINRDGRMDMVVAGYNVNAVLWYQNGGTGDSWTTNTVAVNVPKPTAVSVADINKDGNNDVLAASVDDDALYWWSNTGGTGTNWDKHAVTESPFYNPFSVSAADMNGDGRMDVVSTSESGNKIIWFRNTDGTGLVWDRYDVATLAGAIDAVAADFNGDGYQDIAAAGYDANEIVWYECLNASGTSWTGHVLETSFNKAYSVYACDLEGDGDMDLVGCAAESGKIKVWRNNGDASSWDTEEVATGFAEVRSVWGVDMDGDGDMDVAASSYSLNEVAWWEQRQNSWVKWSVDKTFPRSWAVCAADFNGDGNADLAGCANSMSDTVRWWYSNPIYGLGPFRVLSGDVVTNTVFDSHDFVCAVTGSPIQVDASSRVLCSGWTGSGGLVSGTGTNTGSQTIFDDSGIGWNWATQFLLSVSSDSHGLVDKSSAWYEVGAAVTLKATATDPGYAFVNWSGVAEAVATNNPLMLVMSNGVAVKANFGIEWLTVTVSNGPNGSVNPSGKVIVAKGANQSFELLPSPGYRVSRIFVDGESNGVSDYLEFVNVQADGDLYVEFEQDKIPLQVSSRYGTTHPEANKLSYQAGGTTVTCSVADSPVAAGAFTQYVCTGWSGTGDIPDRGVGTTASGIVMTEYSTITWNWTTQVLLQVSSIGNGTTDVTNEWINVGGERHVRAIADPGYIFTGWSGNVPAGGQHDNPLTVVMDHKRELRAVFDIYQPTIDAAAGNNGIIQPSGKIQVEYASTPEFVITPDEGYRVESVLVDGAPVGLNPIYQFKSVKADHTIVATFTDNSYDVVVVSTHGTAIPPVGTNVVSPDDYIRCSLNGSPVTNETGTRYVCTGWSGTGSIPANGTNLVVDGLYVNTDSSIIWNWTTQYWLSASAGIGGKVNYTNGWENQGQIITLTAVPDEGYSFVSWAGDVSGLDTKTNALVLNIDQARSLTAEFVANKYEITSSASGSGAISPEGKTEVSYGSSQTYLMLPGSGYRVDSVTVDGTNVGAVTSYTFSNVAADHAVSVTFTLDVYYLTVASDYGNPVPANGTRAYSAGETLACSVGNSPVLNGATQHVCTGWTGTGSVPSEGTQTNTGSFSITNASSVTWNWKTYYALSAQAGAHGQVSTTGSWHEAGATNVSVTAKPDNNWRFGGWSGDVPQSKTNDNPLVLDMSRARSVFARFNSNKVYITTVANGPGTILPASYEGRPGSDTQFVITAENAHRIRRVMINSNAVPVTNYYSIRIPFTNITQDYELEVTFGDDTYDLTVQSAYGLVSPAAGVYTYAAGQQVYASLSGTPSPTPEGLSRYVYTYWTGSGSVPVSGTDTNLTIQMDDVSTLAWNWKTQHLVRVNIDGNGTLNVPTDEWYDSTGTVSIAATPKPLNRFVAWQGDVPAGFETNNPLVVATDGPRSITAVFAADFIVLSVDSPYGETRPAIGSQTFDYGTVTSVVLASSYWPSNAAGTQYVCTGWSGTGSAPAAGVSTDTGNFTLTADSSVTWNWNTNYQLSVAEVQGGSVVVSGLWYTAGSTAELRAVAATGYLFAGWSGAVPSEQTNANPLFLVMDYSRGVVPVFVTNRPVLTVVSMHDVVSPAVGTHEGAYGRLSKCEVLTNQVVEGTTRYLSTGWSGTGSVPATGTLTSVNVMMTNDSTITWLWQKQFLLTATGGIDGSVTPSYSWRDAGDTNVEVFAIASNGYQFAGWSGDVDFAADTNANPIHLTMDQARSVRAAFTVLRPTLSVASAHGTCTPSPGIYNQWQQGTPLSLMVFNTPYPSNAVATQYVCIGWSGSGSVPANGPDSHTEITLQEDSAITWNWKTQYWLEVSCNAYGSVRPAGGWYDAGASVTVTPVAAEAHRFYNWTGDLPDPGSTGNVPLVVTMDRSRSLTAVFGTNRPVLEVYSDYGTPVPANGAHAGDYAREVDCIVDCGPITISAATQMVQRGWTGSGSISTNGTTCHLTAVLTNDSTLTWQWYPQYLLSVTSGLHGTVTADAGWHDAGSNVVINAHPDPYYRFVQWTGGDLPAGLSNRAELVLGMNRSYDLTAHFDTNNVEITAGYEGDGCGILSPTGIIEVAPQGSVTFTCTPRAHCRGYLVVDGAYAGFTNEYTFTNVIANHSIHAVFEKEKVDLQVGSTYQNGRFSPPAGLISYDWGSGVTCMVTNSPVTNALTRYTVTGWKGSGSVSNNGTGTQFGPFVLETNSSIVWQWETNYWLDIRSSQYGTVNYTSGWYSTAGFFTIVATPDDHSQFVGWRGDTNSLPFSGNEINVKMDQPRIIEALFVRDQYILTIESSLGMCDPPPGKYPVDYNTPVNVSVTNTPYYSGFQATQYVCTGHTAAHGFSPSTSIVVIVTNDVTLTWLWQTNYYLGLSNTVGGTITNASETVITSEWVEAYSSLILTAIPDKWYTFDCWGGDTNDADIYNNEASFRMRRPRSLSASFTAQYTTNQTPLWWLAQYGITNDFDDADNRDLDGDGYLTWEEWITATDPKNAASLLAMETMAVSGQCFAVSWSCETNRIYQVIRGTNLCGSFEVIASNITAQALESSYLDTNPPAVGPWFYSVEALLPDEP